MTYHTFRMSEKQATNVHKLVNSHMQALKNWMTTAVEKGDLEAAQTLVAELREYQALFAAFNMPAKHEIAHYTAKPLVIEHLVDNRRGN